MELVESGYQEIRRARTLDNKLATSLVGFPMLESNLSKKIHLLLNGHPPVPLIMHVPLALRGRMIRMSNS